MGLEMGPGTKRVSAQQTQQDGYSQIFLSDMSDEYTKKVDVDEDESDS